MSKATSNNYLITQTDKYADLMSKMSKMSKTAPEPAQDNGSGSGHQLDIKNNTNNLMSNKCPTPEPAQDNGSGSGHQLDIKDNTNNLMSNKCPTPEPAQDKGSGHQLDNMDIMDIKNGYLSDDDEGDDDDWTGNDINNDINDISQNLMSSPEASPSKGYDINDINDIKNGYLSDDDEGDDDDWTGIE